MFVCPQCDGVDITHKIKESKIHCLLFLNIPKYSSGTNPWGSSSQFDSPRTDDGKLEVIGFSTSQLVSAARVDATYRLSPLKVSVVVIIASHRLVNTRGIID